MPEITMSDRDHLLSPICEQWLRKIKDAKKIKWERFGQFAVEGMKFFDGTHDWMWKEEYARGTHGFLEKGTVGGMPTFRMQVNRIFEAVAMFGPALYHRNPDVTVTPINYPFVDPVHLGVVPDSEQSLQLYEQLSQAQAMETDGRKLEAELKEHYLNWLQVEGDKKTHARRSITEAIIKGMGIMWTAIYSPPGSQIKYPWSYHISVDDLIIDPDAEYWEDVQWIARYCCRPVNIVERDFHLPEKSLKGHMQSANAQGDIHGSKSESSGKKRSGRSHDLIEYYHVYSKNGFGDRLRKATNDVRSKFNFDSFGDYCRIVVAENIPFPLNMPTHAIFDEDDEQLFDRAQWEVPFWTNGGWPFASLTFYEKPRCVWPVSLIKPAIGELRFINWCMSFLADKTAAACQTYVAIAKQAGVEIQNQIQNGMAPYTVLEISQLTGRSIQDVVSFLQAPNFSVDIWHMLSEVLTLVDKRTGLTDLIYGMSEKQMRSATEADIRESNTNIRPDDMASSVEDFLSEVSVNEIAAAVWSCDGNDVRGQLGEFGAHIWDTKIRIQDFESVMRDYDYRIAAGSARKPNKNTKQRALTELGQVILPTLQTFATSGVVEPWNAYITEIADTMDLDAAGFLLEPPQPQEGPTPEEKMAEMEMQKIAMELEMMQQELEAKKQEVSMKIEAERESADLKAELQEQEIDHDQDVHEQDLQQRRELARQEMLQEKARLAMLTQENMIKLQAMQAIQQAKIQTARSQAAAKKEPQES